MIEVARWNANGVVIVLNEDDVGFTYVDDYGRFGALSDADAPNAKAAISYMENCLGLRNATRIEKKD